MPGRSPFFKLLLPFILGVIVSVKLPSSIQTFQVLLGIFVVMGGLSYFRISGLEGRILARISLPGIFFALGACLTGHSSSTHQGNNLAKAGTEGIFYIKVSGTPQVNQKTVKIRAEVLGRITPGNQIMIVGEEALLYLPRGMSPPGVGGYLFFKGRFITILEPANPYQFNYKAFMERQGIRYQAFVGDSVRLRRVTGEEPSFTDRLKWAGPRYLKPLIAKFVKDSIASAVTESLLFGYKEDLPKSLMAAYAHTGTLHVLAVSGMHVALVFFLLTRSLSFLDRHAWGKRLKTGMVLGAIWGYCFLTGLAPSILRAGIMISLLAIGELLGRRTAVFNLLSASALLILLINPLWLFDIGFQLSFAAVAGIIYLNPLFASWWRPSNRVLREVWGLLTVSLAAQAATFPVSLYYFNQFPNYFLVSNLLIVPLSTLIIYMGVGLLFCARIFSLASFMGSLVKHLVGFLNDLVFAIERLPYSYLDGWKVDMMQVVFLYAGIFSLAWWMSRARRRGVFLFLISLCLYGAVSLKDKCELQKVHHMVRFSVPQGQVFLMTDGKRSILLKEGKKTKECMFFIRGWLIQKRLWPIYKVYDLDQIMHHSAFLKEMGFGYDHGRIFFENWEFRFVRDDKRIELRRAAQVNSKKINNAGYCLDRSEQLWGAIPGTAFTPEQLHDKGRSERSDPKEKFFIIRWEE